MDLRITKTYLALTKAFQELLEEKLFEDITVNELCKRAMIRRATFYKHFADKYDFFAFMVRDIQEKHNENRNSVEGFINMKDELLDIVKYALDYVEGNKRLVRSILKSSALDVLLNILSEQISIDVLFKFRQAKRNGIELPTNPEIMAQIFTGSLIQILRWWIIQKDPIDKDTLVDNLSKVIEKF